MKSPVWTLPQGVFQALTWGAIILLAIAIIVILAIFASELRNRRVW